MTPELSDHRHVRRGATVWCFSALAPALFERLRDANILLQEGLRGAQTNLNSIEQILSTRVAEFVSTIGTLVEGADAATGKIDQHVSSFYGLTSKVLADLGELAVQFDGHGRALADAVNMLDKSNKDSIVAVDNRTGELDERLKAFSTLLDESLRTAGERAREVAALVADATSQGARAIAEQHAAIRSTTEEEGKRTHEALHQLYEQVSNESKGLFQQNASEAQQLLQQATDRFVGIMGTMKQMSLDMQRELDNTREALRRGVLELPEETAESTAQMRRVIVDQMEALAELNRIVARHGRSMDTVSTAPEAAPPRRVYREETAVNAAASRHEAIRQVAPRSEANMTAPVAPGPSRGRRRARCKPFPSQRRLGGHQAVAAAGGKMQAQARRDNGPARFDGWPPISR
jgi:hypothetical protein